MAGRLRNSLTGLYTPQERERRDASPWTLVQGVLAPFQFLVFLAEVLLNPLEMLVSFLRLIFAFSVSAHGIPPVRSRR